MTLLLDLPSDLESRLREAAKQRGVSLDECARRFLEDGLAQTETPTAEPVTPQATVAERLRAFHELVDYFNSFNVQAPPIPLDALRRENLYEDRG